MNRNTSALTSAAILLGAFAGTAMAQPVVDGRRDAAYGPPVAVQRSSVIDFEAAPRVQIAAQSDQSNVGGKGEYAIAGTQSAPNESDPALVERGVEIAIRLADLPGGGSGFPGNVIKIAGFISGGDYLSNQVIGGLDGDPDNLGSEVRSLNFETGHSGKQYLAVSTATRSSVAPTIDGVKSPSESYGPRAPQNNVGTGFGSNSVNPPEKNASNGSEINGAYGYIYNNGTPGNPNDDVLVLFIAGNLEPNFNRLNLFIDCATGGQNTLRRDNSTQGFNVLGRWGENLDGTNPSAPGDIGPGLTFDADCSPDIWLSINHGGNGPSTTNAAREGYCDSAVLPTGGNGADTYFGPATIGLTAGTPATGMVAGGSSADAIQFEIDNSNSSGADAVAPNNGGVGGRANLPGGGSQADVTDPGTVTTGVEVKVDLFGAGWDGVSPVKVAGIIVGFNWDYMSNQAIGGLTMAGNTDPGNLGFPAKDVDFNLWDGDQFVTVTPSMSIPPAPVGAAIDGRLNSSAQEQGAYGAPLWVNTTNASAFGNHTGPASVDRSLGSELDAVYAYIALDPSNGNKPTLYLFAAGNLHDFNKLIFFLDTNPAEGQNDLRGDNAGVGNFNGGLGGPDGFTFDTGFTADYAISYEIGYNNDLMQAEHYLNGLQLLTNGGGFGGLVAGGAKNGVTPPLSGEIVARVGFGDNDLTPLSESFFDRTILANGSELDAVYMYVDAPNDTLYVFLAGNLEPNFTNVELFFDTESGTGQNTLIFSDKDPQDPLYTGNPDVDFGALNRMGGPILDDMMQVVNPGLTFDTGFEPDYYFSYRMGNFEQLGSTPGDGVASIYGNWARLRTVFDPIGPMPSDAGRNLGVAINDSLGSSPYFENGDQFEPINAAAINNANTGGVPGGASFLCNDGGGTDPATVARGMEFAIDMNDLNWNGDSPIKFQVFINGVGHANISNQILPHACTNDLGEPRNVNFNSLPGLQYISWPTPNAAPPACSLPGDADGDGEVNFSDINSVIANWLANYGSGNTGAGDANSDGVVNFDDINAVIANWLLSAGCS